MPKELIYLVPSYDDDSYDVYYYNRVYVGIFYKEVDGYYVFAPKDFNGGAVETHFLHALAEKLDELNQEWDQEVIRYFAVEQIVDEIEVSDMQRASGIIELKGW